MLDFVEIGGQHLVRFCKAVFASTYLLGMGIARHPSTLEYDDVCHCLMLLQYAYSCEITAIFFLHCYYLLNLVRIIL